MKFTLQHFNHQPTKQFNELVHQRIEALREALQIDEARVHIERQMESSPAFKISAHLVTPGPDILAEAVDHTLRAALQKLLLQLEARIEHRHRKRAIRIKSHLTTVLPKKSIRPPMPAR